MGILHLAKESRKKYEVTAANRTKQVATKGRSGQTAGAVISNLRRRMVHCGCHYMSKSHDGVGHARDCGWDR